MQRQSSKGSGQKLLCCSWPGTQTRSILSLFIRALSDPRVNLAPTWVRLEGSGVDTPRETFHQQGTSHSRLITLVFHPQLDNSGPCSQGPHLAGVLIAHSNSLLTIHAFSTYLHPVYFPTPHLLLESSEKQRTSLKSLCKCLETKLRQQIS